MDTEATDHGGHNFRLSARHANAQRNWWRLHLATLLILAFIANLFVWMGTRSVPAMAIYGSDTGELIDIIPSAQGSQLARGWPLLAYSDGRGGRVHPANLGIDLGILAAFFVVAAMNSELLIRRRFTFHLSTAVVMMVGAALMTGVVVRFGWLDRDVWHKAPASAVAVCLCYIALLAATLLVSERMHRNLAKRRRPATTDQ